MFFGLSRPRQSEMRWRRLFRPSGSLALKYGSVGTRTSRGQWCWRRFVINPRPGDVSALVNFHQNPWFPAELEAERIALQTEEPDRYQHVYMGLPDDGDANKQVLTYVVLQQCIEAWKEGLAPDKSMAPVTDAGLDIAEGGKDKCAHVVRVGPTVEHIDKWPGIAGNLAPAAKRSHEHNQDWGIFRQYYDASSPMRGEFNRIEPPVQYGVVPINFGGEVGGPKVLYEPRRPNNEVFRSRNIQMADALRLRAARTIRLRNGADVDPTTCLFIRPDLPNMEEYLADLTQPIRRQNPQTGKWELDKRGGDEAANSPDLFDATCLAFCRDTEHPAMRLSVRLASLSFPPRSDNGKADISEEGIHATFHRRTEPAC